MESHIHQMVRRAICSGTLRVEFGVFGNLLLVAIRLG
jgi:hypothetical protein